MEDYILDKGFHFLSKEMTHLLQLYKAMGSILGKLSDALLYLSHLSMGLLRDGRNGPGWWVSWGVACVSPKPI